jgi:hypothetical protein
MLLTLIRPKSEVVNRGLEQNAGFDRISDELARLEDQDHKVEVADGESLPDDERTKLIREIQTWAVFSKTKVVHTFGTNTDPWCQFGTEAPVLIVREGGELVGVYPHVSGSGFRTIADFLASL